MARIIGVEVPPNKRIDIALRYIYGIGASNAKDILANAKIDPSIRAKDVTEPGRWRAPARFAQRPFVDLRQISRA